MKPLILDDFNCKLNNTSAPGRDDPPCYTSPSLTLYRFSIPNSPSIITPLYDSDSAASLSALLALFSKRLVLLAPKIACCLCSTPVNHHPKLPPMPANAGYAHSDSLLKNGRISRPSCQNRVARPKPAQKRTLWTILRARFACRM